MKKDRYKTKKGCLTSFIPKQSYRYGFEDEGISSVLNKPVRFRYSGLFLRNWYKQE
jgi:hypothetical protein